MASVFRAGNPRAGAWDKGLMRSDGLLGYCTAYRWRKRTSAEQYVEELAPYVRGWVILIEERGGRLRVALRSKTE